MKYKVAIASDFSGFELKEAVRKHLLAEGHDVQDVGQKTAAEQVLYFDASAALAKTVQSRSADRGIVICGTGAGVSLIANKFKGVYCVACESMFTAQRTSLINNANVLAMGQKVVTAEMACEMASAWLKGVWCDGFEQQRRLNNERGFAALQEIETENFK